MNTPDYASDVPPTLESTTGAPPPTGSIQVSKSLLARAKNNERAAVETMFRQFLKPDEEILFAEYMGVQGLWGIGKQSFACLTSDRIASIMVGPWGEVFYQDGAIECQNSGLMYQPGVLGLYLLAILYGIAALIFTFGIGLLLLPFIVQGYYRMHKCGIVWVIREGVSVYLFTNRNRLVRANHLYRLASEQRFRRLRALGWPAVV